MFETGPDSLIGKTVGDRYRLTQRLASGGMGVVYRAERLKLGRTVAIKFLHRTFAGRPDALRRFEIEAQAMGRLGHPHCVSVIDFGVEEDLPYLVMDFVHGKDLRELLDAGPLPLPRALAIFRQILAGVAHAHGQGIIHRDLKPANIMLTEATGTGDHVRILDFGLAKLGDAPMGETSRALAIGTPAYMAPEQARGEAADARTDVYSLGVLLFEMVVGDKPFFSDQAYEVIQMHANMPPPKLRHRAPADAGVSQALEDLVTRAMAKKPEDRYQTVAEMAEALAQVPEVTGAARAATLPPPDLVPPPARDESAVAEPPPARPTLWLVLGVMLAIGGLGFLVVRFLSPPPPPQSPPPSHAATAPPPRPVPAPPPAIDAAPPPADAAPPPAIDAAPPPPVDAAPPPVDAAPPPLDDAPPPVEDEDVHALIVAGKNAEAISVLNRLRRENPKSAYFPYLLGNLYFDRTWWSEGIDQYRAAIKLNRTYRGRATLIRNTIHALSSDRTHKKARALLLTDVGALAVPHLRAAAKNDPSRAVRDRAAALLKQLSRRR